MKKEERYSKDKFKFNYKKSQPVINANVKCSQNFHVHDGMIEVNEEEIDLSYSLVQWTKKHLSQKHRYFEVKFLSDITKDQLVMIGTNPCSNGSPMEWDKDRCIRYCSTEGGIFTSNGGLRSDFPFGNEGDVITVYLEEIFKRSSLINFFLNGQLVYRQWLDVAHTCLYPTIGVSKGPARFKVTWPGHSKEPRVKLGVEKVHTLLSHWIGYRNIKKEDDTEILEVTQQDQVKRHGYSLQAPRPLTNVHNYFEVELLTRIDPNNGPAVGLTSAWTSKFQYPGCKHDTIGYHSDKGVICNDGNKCSDEPNESSQYKIGDRIGCGIVFSNKDHTKRQFVIVYFTKNGEIIHVTPKMLPMGGFYPTVGLYPSGEKVRVINPCIETKVSLPKEEISNMKKSWMKLYKQFKFHETISFDDYLSCGTTRRLSIKHETEKAQLIHHKCGIKDFYMLKFEVIELGDRTEIYVRSVPGCYLTTQRYIFNDITIKDVLCFSKKTGLSVGDKVLVIIHVNSTGLLITCIKNGTIFRQTSAAKDRTPNWEDQMPTLAFQNGIAVLDVTWSGDPEFLTVQNNRASIDLYIKEHMLPSTCTKDNESHESDISIEDLCSTKESEDQNEAKSEKNGAECARPSSEHGSANALSSESSEDKTEASDKSNNANLITVTPVPVELKYCTTENVDSTSTQNEIVEKNKTTGKDEAIKSETITTTVKNDDDDDNDDINSGCLENRQADKTRKSATTIRNQIANKTVVNSSENKSDNKNGKILSAQYNRVRKNSTPGIPLMNRTAASSLSIKRNKTREELDKTEIVEEQNTVETQGNDGRTNKKEKIGIASVHDKRASNLKYGQIEKLHNNVTLDTCVASDLSVKTTKIERKGSTPMETEHTPREMERKKFITQINSKSNATKINVTKTESNCKPNNDLNSTRSRRVNQSAETETLITNNPNISSIKVENSKSRNMRSSQSNKIQTNSNSGETKSIAISPVKIEPNKNANAFVETQTPKTLGSPRKLGTTKPGVKTNKIEINGRTSGDSKHELNDKDQNNATGVNRFSNNVLMNSEKIEVKATAIGYLELRQKQKAFKRTLNCNSNITGRNTSSSEHNTKVNSDLKPAQNDFAPSSGKYGINRTILDTNNIKHNTKTIADLKQVQHKENGSRAMLGTGITHSFGKKGIKVDTKNSLNDDLKHTHRVKGGKNATIEALNTDESGINSRKIKGDRVRNVIQPQTSKAGTTGNTETIEKRTLEKRSSTLKREHATFLFVDEKLKQVPLEKFLKHSKPVTPETYDIELLPLDKEYHDRSFSGHYNG